MVEISDNRRRRYALAAVSFTAALSMQSLFTSSRQPTTYDAANDVVEEESNSRHILSTIIGDPHTVLLREKYQERFLFTNDDNNNDNNTSISIIDNNNSCELPHCSTILRSRLYSERCDHTSPLFRPLLITGTPRSATTYTSQKLRSLGIRIQNDWLFPHLPHGRVSWIYAFEDPKPFGRVKDLSHNEKYLHVLHQVKEPLASITSMCTEPIGKDKYWKFLGRHIRFTSSFEYPRRIR